MDAFIPLPLRRGAELHLDGVAIRAFVGGERLEGGAVYGFLASAGCVVLPAGRLELAASTWFVGPPGTTVERGEGLAILVPGYTAPSQVGGPLEATGRLRYIDGCTDTLLAGPTRRGEPCANHLHIPAGTRQSAHHHPSLRAGVIARGAGTCVTESARYALAPGLGWVIPRGLQHSFHTDEHALDVWAWHPDSDTGPTDEDHPMRNRTWGV